MEQAFLEGETIYLRGLRQSDVQPGYMQWFNDPVTCQYNSHALFPNNEQRMTEYVDRVQRSTDTVVFAIIEKTGNGHIGNISLQQIDWVSRNAEIAWIISREHSGKGFGTEAGKLVIAYAFERLNLIRVHCGTSEHNIAMQKVAEKLGMKKEGVRQKAMYKMGAYVDLIEYGIVREGAI